MEWLCVKWLCQMAQTCWLRKLSLGWDGILHPLQMGQRLLHVLVKVGSKAVSCTGYGWIKGCYMKWVNKPVAGLPHPVATQLFRSSSDNPDSDGKHIGITALPTSNFPST